MSRVILVTGANRGIGFAIIQSLAMHPITTNSILLLGCRDVTKGDEAIKELKKIGCSSSMHTIPLDINSDESIRYAVSTITSKLGHLDILINNAAYAAIPSEPDFSDYRKIYGDVFETNITSIAITTQLFLPLLRKSRLGGKVIQVSSARGSITRSRNGELPPTVSIPYCVSKTALNMLTVELSRDVMNKDVEFCMASPGHCKTGFNNFKGARDPVEGANVVVELVIAEKGTVKTAVQFETHGTSRELIQVPW